MTDAHLVSPAVVKTESRESREFSLHALLVMLQLLTLDLLPHFPGLLDGLHHSILVSEQCRGVQIRQDICKGVRHEDTQQQTHYLEGPLSERDTLGGLVIESSCAGGEKKNKKRRQQSWRVMPFCN